MYDVNWSPDGGRVVVAGAPDVARVFHRDGTLDSRSLATPGD